MELNELRVFLAVAEELHFGRAALRLHMAQPPVSRTIKALEEELNVLLFNRTTRFVSLTPAGEALIEPARRILSEIRRAADDVAAAGRGESGRVGIAYAGASTHVMVGRLARYARRKFPGIILELSSQNFAIPAMSRVLRQEVDIGMGRWDQIPAGIETRLIAEEQLVMAVPLEHRLANADSASMSDFADDQFVTLPPHEGSVLGDRFRRLCHSSGFEPEVVQVAPDSWTALSLVAATVGCSLTLSTVAENTHDPHLSFVPISDAVPPVQLRMAWRADSDSKALRAILALSQEVLPSPGSKA